jgi:hypothetical protein
MHVPRQEVTGGHDKAQASLGWKRNVIRLLVLYACYGNP